MNPDGQTRLKASLVRAKAGGSPSIGQWLVFPGHDLATTVASSGPDWVLIDCEHGSLSEDEMRLAVKAVAAAGASPIVRIAGAESWLIKRALDCGAHGLMVPMVETVAQAELIASASRYPSTETGFPEGTRGLGGLFAPAPWGLGVRYAEYAVAANTQLVVIVQIETPEGVKNCEAIAVVKGIDALFIGPNDLAASMGLLGRDHTQVPEFQEAGEKVLRAAKDAGKFAGYFCMNADAAAARVKEGWEFVSCGVDMTAILLWMSMEMGRLRTMVKKDE